MALSAKAGSNRTFRLAISRPGVWVIAAIGLFVAALMLTNIMFHKVVILNTAETDAYFLQADTLLRSGGYSDRYRPPLYTVLIAALSYLSGMHTLLAANLISSVAAGWIVLNSYWITKQFAATLYACVAALLVASDQLVLQYGLCGCTDALFAALATSVLLLLLLLYRTSGRALITRAIMLGAAFGLAYLTRYVATSLLLVIAVGVWQLKQPPALRIKLLAITGGSALVVAAPWLVYSAITSGSPFTNDNWRNFAFALYGQGDYSYLQNNPFSGYLDVFLFNPANVFTFWNNNVLELARHLLDHSSSLALAIFLPLGLFKLVTSAPGRVLLLYIIASILPIVAVFVYLARLFLDITPVLIVVGVIGLASIGQRWPRLTPLVVLVLAVALWMPLQQIPTTISRFFQDQPTVEVQMLDQLVESQPISAAQPLRIASTYKYAGNFVQQPALVEAYYVPFFDQNFPQLLLDTVAAHRIEYVLISDLTARGALQTGRLATTIPACWQPEQERPISVGVVRLYRNMCDNMTR